MESHFDTSVYGRDALAPPGTFLLIREDMSESRGQRTIMLDPIPTNDPNEPLNWSTLRKAVNWTIVLGMTIVTFTLLSIQPIFWQQMIVDLRVDYDQLNQSMSVNYVGLAMGCVVFIPVAKKFGRRPVYIVSASVLLATSFWMSRLETLTELYVCNLLQGLGGAVNETIAMITIADLFFVHHRGSMNGLYMIMMMIGSFLTPMAAGTQATRQGWRWSYTTLGIFNALFVILFIFLYEETKYTPIITGTPRPGTAEDDIAEDDSAENTGDPDAKKVPSVTKASVSDEPSAQNHQLDTSIPISSWQKRLALVTATSESIWPYYYRPFKALFTFPAVMFAGLQYAAGVIWLTILSSVVSLVFPLPPYLFTPEQIGFMSLGPFIGNLLGNNGFYEPEMRLYILHLPALTMAGGLIMFGATVERGMHWIYPSVGGALFGFGLGSIGDASLTLVIDSYRDITGDAFTAIAFLRNACSIGIPFAITPWIARNGLQNMFIACGFISFGVTLLAVPMIFWGKTARQALAVRYYRLVEQQGSVG
ncbi:hypothetical protein N7533_013594 [Penicillium manginii]|uniref:uncharacterized protein n=1 Tax=Penicillium manginii TaxID=203109 RepID=UPI002547D644|nr:uncharacterized protein N7533_013594 [Penicillium manginii]KAJ5733147.1 hypothetical protein N7533_013594 [Penicillium manginii]